MNLTRLIKLWLLMAIVALSANDAVKANIASGLQNLRLDVHQEKSESKPLMRQGKTECSTTVVLVLFIEEDKETGLLYAKARFYDPDTGKFLSEDAWEGDNMIAPSLHRYLYAYQNPTVYIDPDGNKSIFGDATNQLQDFKEYLGEQNKEVDSTAGAIAIGTAQFVTSLGQVVTGGLDIAANVAQEAVGVDDQQVRDELVATRGALTNGIDFLVNGDYGDAVGKAHQAAVNETSKAFEGDVTATSNVTQGVLGLALLKSSGPKGRTKLVQESTSKPATATTRERVLANIAESKKAREASNLGKGLSYAETKIPNKSVLKLLTARRDAASAQDILGSFKGPITAQRGKVGEKFDVVSGLTQQASGVFMARGLSAYTPLQRQQILALPNQVKSPGGLDSGWVNNAIKLQQGVLTREQILLKGRVRGQGGQNKKGVQRDEDIFGPTPLPGGHEQIISNGGRFTGAIEIRN